MPKFMKNRAIELMDGGVEMYLLAIYGMSLPTFRTRRRQDSRYAPIMGLLGASVELVSKACLVQAKGINAMYKKGDNNSQIYKFGTEVINELKSEIKNDTVNISFMWKSTDDHKNEREQLIDHLNKFILLQEMRANGLHAGRGTSRDIAIATANDVYHYFELLAMSKKMSAYLKNIPTPEKPVIEREAIIEDLSRRLSGAKESSDKLGYLKSMYLVLPYVPEIAPDWISKFENFSTLPPQNDDVNYLIQTLSDARSIYLLKNRGGQQGVPVRVESNNPNALPIAIQNIKRVLNTIPDQFNNDVLSANTRLEQNRLDLPIDDFLIDLYGLGLDNAKVVSEGKMLTAQQTWPFVVSAYSTQGAPRPCWNIIKRCDEIDKLISFLKRVKQIGNGYYSRRVDDLIRLVEGFNTGEVVAVRDNSKEKIFSSIKELDEKRQNMVNPFTPSYIYRNPNSGRVSDILKRFLSNKYSAGKALEKILSEEVKNPNDRSVAIQLMRMCIHDEDRNGLIAVLRSDSMKTYHSEARKSMFMVDILHNGPKLKFS